MPLKRSFDVIVIGAGASGLMCAMTAAERGRSVLVLDSSNKVGKKILMSGGGRCNFTNLLVEPDNFISNNPHFCKSALNGYSSWDFIALVEKHQIPYEERKHGQLFCLNSSKDILDMLLFECKKAAVEIHSSCPVKTISASGEPETALSFELQSGQGVFSCQSLVIASGALSIPTLGASGYAYEVAGQFGLALLPRRAGLVPFMFSGVFLDFCERLSGVSVQVEASIGQISFTEAMLFTHRGLSGPAILQISNSWLPGEQVFINLLPGMDLDDYLKQQKTSQGKSLLRTVLNQYLTKSLVLELQNLFWLDESEKALAEFSIERLSEIARLLQHWPLKPAATEGYRTAEVTLGGIDTNELSSQTMESKKQKGLYFIGEAVDVTGHLGGFNFQWAWASGFAAGKCV